MRPRGSFVLPLVLIVAGVVLLLNNLGLVLWDVWGMIARLWPILLIALGLDLLLGRASLRWAVALAITAVVAGAVALALFGPHGGGASSIKDVRIPLKGAVRGEVDLACPVGTVLVRAAPDPALLVAGTLTIAWHDQVKWNAVQLGDTIRFTLATERRPGLPSLAWADRSRTAVELTPSVPIALGVALGAGTASLDLSGLNLTELIVRAGDGTATVTLPARGQLQATLVGGSGEVTVRIPGGRAARIRVEPGAGRVDVIGGFLHEGVTYTSPGYETAEERMELTVQAGSGRITVQSFQSI
ncbi:hypothetical protein H5T53_06025 [Candidatus Bipolaricaulota bacterium]|nr:hypothetical protein [Candidatus Bipolaricaulota bacterium]